MIQVDPAVGSKELAPIIRALGVPCNSDVSLGYGDAAFEGNGPDGNIAVGIERKALHDMLHCIEDHRYNRQRIGMKNLYNVSVLIIEGYWKPREDGILMESRNGIDWWPCRPGGSPVMYSKLRRYLISVRYSGVSVMFTRNLQHTAYDICEEYHYHQKSWAKHTSLKEIQKLNIPQLSGKPSLCRKWAADLDGVGLVMGEEADRHFRRKAIKLATSEESDWVACGAGPKKAQDIIKQIHGLS